METVYRQRRPNAFCYILCSKAVRRVSRKYVHVLQTICGARTLLARRYPLLLPPPGARTYIAPVQAGMVTWITIHGSPAKFKKVRTVLEFYVDSVRRQR